MKYLKNKFLVSLSIQLLISSTIMAATCKQTVPNSALVKDGTLVMSTNPTLPPLQFVDSTGTAINIATTNFAIAQAVALG